MLTAILATTRQGGLGFRGDIPWRAAKVPKELTQPDMQMFQKYTMGKTCVFGGATYVGMRKKRTDNETLLPGRTCYWVGREIENPSEADIRFNSVDVLVSSLNNFPSEQEIVVCGGLKLYEALMPYTDKIIWNCFGFECPFDVRWPHHPNDLAKMGFELRARQLVHPLLGTAIFYRNGTKAPW